MHARRSAIVAALGITSLAAVVGCSRSDRPPLGLVSGSVTLDGQPLPNALVIFTPDGPGRTSLGTTDEAGTYTLLWLRDIRGANVGGHRVRITTANEENGHQELLPNRYHTKSELAADVKAGSNRIDFALESR